MTDMYTRMVLDHSKRSGVPQELQITLLMWVTRAERPLRLLEVASVLESEHKALGFSRNTKSIIRQGCGPLLEILEDESVRPIHHSVTEFLYDPSRQLDRSTAALFLVLDFQEAHRSLAMTCIKYLASDWHSSSEKQSSEILNSKLNYPFLDYAATHCHKNVLKLGLGDETLSYELDKIFVSDRNLLHAWLGIGTIATDSEDLDNWGKKSSSPLHVAAYKGLAFYVEHLILAGNDIDSTDRNERTPLALATKKAHAETVAVLLRNGAHNDSVDKDGLKPLHYAAFNNHYSVVELLLSSGVMPHTPKTKEDPEVRIYGRCPTLGDSPLKYAIIHGHVETVEAFLPHLDSNSLLSALQWAIGSGQTKMAMLLLKASRFEHNDINSLLLTACCRRNIQLMRLLLEMGA